MKTFIEIPETGIGDLSDGYHTFNELYHHRAVLFSVICNTNPEFAWKSKLHDTGDMFDGMFIVGIDTPEGPATYHYDIDPYWNMFNVKELEKAPAWDGHSSSEAISRISGIYKHLIRKRKVEKKALINSLVNEIKNRFYHRATCRGNVHVIEGEQLDRIATEILRKTEVDK